MIAAESDICKEMDQWVVKQFARGDGKRSENILHLHKKVHPAKDLLFFVHRS